MCSNEKMGCSYSRAVGRITVMIGSIESAVTCEVPAPLLLSRYLVISKASKCLHEEE